MANKSSKLARNGKVKAFMRTHRVNSKSGHRTHLKRASSGHSGG